MKRTLRLAAGLLAGLTLTLSLSAGQSDRPDRRKHHDCDRHSHRGEARNHHDCRSTCSYVAPVYPVYPVAYSQPVWNPYLNISTYPVPPTPVYYPVAVPPYAVRYPFVSRMVRCK